MPNLKEVKTRIQSVSSTQQITKAMKMVAAAKLRKAQDAIIALRPYATRLTEVLKSLTAGSGVAELSSLSGETEEESILIIPISSDRGLCGAFNSNVAKASMSVINKRYASQLAAGNVTILPLGKKSWDYFRKRSFKMEDSFYEIFQDLNFESVSKISNFVMKQFEDGVYDKVEIVYNEFKNVATQVIQTEQYLPIVPPEGESSDVDYIYEPSLEFIINELIPNSLRVQLFKALLESNASEHGARMTAMDQATENADALLKDLNLTYNKARQAAITNEILEIVSGAEALKG